MCGTENRKSCRVDQIITIFDYRVRFVTFGNFIAIWLYRTGAPNGMTFRFDGRSNSLFLNSDTINACASFDWDARSKWSLFVLREIIHYWLTLNVCLFVQFSIFFPYCWCLHPGLWPYKKRFEFAMRSIQHGIYVYMTYHHYPNNIERKQTHCIGLLSMETGENKRKKSAAHRRYLFSGNQNIVS